MKHEATHAYYALCRKCQKAIFFCTDDPRYAKDTAKEVANLIRCGHPVSRDTIDEVRKIDWCECNKPAATQTCMFGGRNEPA